MTEPPLKWAGGKRWLVPRLRESLPIHQRLVEPFMGGLSVSLGVQPRVALVNDLNPHLVNFYQQAQNGLTLDLPYGHAETDFYAARTEFNAGIQAGQIQTPRMAMLFYYLNRTGFNGLCRFNNAGLFNVPFGRYAKINYRKDFADLAPALVNFSIRAGDFAGLPYQDGDVIYADPPYDTAFTSYSVGGFDWAEQERVAQFFTDLGLPVILSNQATSRVLELYSDLGYDVETLPAPRRIASNGNRCNALEMLASRGVHK